MEMRSELGFRRAFSVMNGLKGGFFHSPFPALFVKVELTVLGGQGAERGTFMLV